MTTSLRRSGRLVVVIAMAIALVGFFAGSAAAASPPTAVTGPPSDYAITAVTVAGNVNPGGMAVTWYFQYGTTTGYGLSSTHEGGGAGTSSESVSVRLGGLTPGTTYHYRLVATSAGGTAYGSDASFRTPEDPPSVGKTSVTVLSDTTAKVTSDIDPNGLATSWYARYGTSPGLGQSSPVHSAGSGTSSVGVSTDLAKLAPNTTYYLDIVAKNSAATRVGSEVSFATTGEPIIGSETVSELASTSVLLVASVSPDGHATSWYFQYGTAPTYSTHTTSQTTSATRTAQTVTKLLKDLVPNTTYHFRLVARNSSGRSLGPDATFTTPGPTLSTASSSVQFDRSTTLMGTIPVASANQSVEIFEQATGTASFSQLTTVLTSSSGQWAYSVSPRIGTLYKALWAGEVSPVVSIGVRPGVTLRSGSTGRFFTHVNGPSRFSGRLVRLQRLEHNKWRAIAVARLNRSSSAVFTPRLRPGRVKLRVLFTAYQAGPGFVTGKSGVHFFGRS